MTPPGNVIHVDFRKPGKPPSGGFGGGPSFSAVVFLSAVGVLLVFFALVAPRWMTSGFFAPTVALLGVLATVAARRLRARYQIARYAKRLRAEAAERAENKTGHTLH